MRIIIPLVGIFGKSGGWRVLSKLANEWIDHGHDVQFLAYEQTGDPYFPTRADIMYYDLKGNIKTENNTKAISPILGPFKLRKALMIAINKLNADILLATHSFTAYPVKKSIIDAKKFYYVQAYEPDYYYKNNLKTKIFKWMSIQSYKLNLNTIVNSPMYLNYREINTEMFVFPGLDTKNFSPVKKNKSETIVLGTIGRPEEYKGTKYIIDAFKILRERLEEKIELHIAFGDSLLQNEKGIKILRPDGDDQLAKFYQSLDIYICAGTIQLEAVHYPVIEAMACKIPVITTGYLPSSSSNAWLVPVKNPQRIVDSVFEIINSDSKDRIERAYHDIKIFEWENVSQKMLDYFNAINTDSKYF